MQKAPGQADVVRLLIDTDLDYLDRLIKLLQGERKALETRDVACLQATLKEKTTLLSAIESNGRQRDRNLQMLGIDANPGNWRKHLDDLIENEAPALRGKWQLLLERLQLCSELTEINARIVSRTQHSLGKMLDLLRGQHSSQATTYDSLGRSRRHFDNRPITSA